jgi:hypothetical protein
MVTVRVGRVKIALASPYPLQEPFARAHERLTRFMPLWTLLKLMNHVDAVWPY